MIYNIHIILTDPENIRTTVVTENYEGNRNEKSKGVLENYLFMAKNS